MKSIQLLTAVFLLSIQLQLQAQQLLNPTNLNPDGVVHAVIEDTAHNSYILAGDFTSINFQSWHNLAILNKDLTTNTTVDLGIQSIDGPIRTLNMFEDVVGNVYLYIGGDFSQVNGQPRNRMAALIAPAANPNTFLLQSADAQIQTGTGTETVSDLYVSGDTLIVSGHFFWVDSTLYEERNCIAAYKLPGLSLLQYPDIAHTSFNPVKDHIYKVQDIEGKRYVCGSSIQGASNTASLVRLTATGSVDPGFMPYFNAAGRGVYDFEQDSTHSIFSIASNVNGSNYFRRHDLNGNDISYNSAHDTLGFHVPYNLATIDDTIFLYREGLHGYDLSDSSLYWNANINPVTIDRELNQIEVVDKKLFVSARNLSDVDGATRIGLAVFCLEPDTVPCPDTPTMVQGYSLANRTLHAFPNPSHGEITIKIPEALRAGQIRVWQMDGRMVYASDIGKRQTVELSGLPTGLLLVDLVTPDFHFQTKVVVIE